MTSTVVVSEKRNVIDNFKGWYKEKIIDTGMAKKFEEGLVGYHELQKNILNVAGKVATVILAVYPADGPLGETLAIVTSPLLTKLLDLQNKTTEMAVINAKRAFEAKFIKADGSSENVVLPKIDFDNLGSEVNEVIGQFKELDNTTKGVKR